MNGGKDAAPKNKPRHTEVNVSSVKDGDENEVQIYFPSIPWTPTLRVTAYYYLLYILTGTFFTVFPFLKYVRQLDGISPRDKSSP